MNKLKNKKFQQFKDFKEKFDVLWSDPKSHAKIMLSFWLIVVLFLSLMVRLGSGNIDSTYETHANLSAPTGDLVKDYLRGITSYEASVIVNDTENFYVTNVSNESLIVYNNETYYFKNKLYLISNNELVPVDNIISDIGLFDVAKIYDLIKDLDEEFMTIYKDGSYLINYNVFYDNDFIKVVLCGNGNVNKIDVILPSYRVEINLNSINSVDKISFGVDVDRINFGLEE